ncbi:aminotransferase class I/II-fold pyridoxal phosphate-dependent enzyme [Ihubacter sp. rT4E-8]|uniref:aminotransferase class I/II-fold pyridoxal phosphate-dependent enzyme n=1 Tax=Ihubacter sp. rT4E-8 TaxID=3242369 RepID=UPI003CE92858
MERFKNIESASGAWITVDGRQVLSFGGCCYLGLAKMPALLEAGERALEQFGMTAPLSRYYGFSQQPEIEVIEAAKDFFGTEDAMYFSTGYLFGMIALNGIADRYDVIFLDEKTHFSLREGAVVTGKPVFTFQHMDAANLKDVVRKNLQPGQIPLVATDGMFPTFGDIPPLDAYQTVLKDYGGWLVVDESHSFGAVGGLGGGAVEKYGLDRERVIAGGSLAKAFCAFGGIATGSAQAIDSMRNASAARGSTGGTASSQAVAAASLNYVKSHPEMLEKLRINTKRLKDGLKSLGISVEDSESPVSTFTIGNAETMITLQKDLWEKGIFVGYTTYVGAGPAGAIRCAVFSDHEPEDIDRLLQELETRI